LANDNRTVPISVNRFVSGTIPILLKHNHFPSPLADARPELPGRSPAGAAVLAGSGVAAAGLLSLSWLIFFFFTAREQYFRIKSSFKLFCKC
jgi:hypothetical protein